MIESTLVITNIIRNDKSYRVCCLYKDGTLEQLAVRNFPDPSLVGNIYLAKVENVQKNIGGAFANTGEGRCYISDRSLKPGDEVLVQIKKDAVGEKHPYAVTEISLAGKYVVVEEGETNLGYSSRISESKKNEIRAYAEFFESLNKRIIFRTNCENADIEDIKNEAAILNGTILSLRNNEKSRTVHSLMYTPLSFYIQFLTGLKTDYPQKITTDDPVVYNEVLSRAGEAEVEYYRDNYPLAKLFNIDSDVERLLKKRVYLKSGAELVIEQTEAFVSIDVNSGNNIKGKVPEDTYFNVNVEAAREIARQIRLRNLAGIILVDFINLNSKEKRAALLSEMKTELLKDPIRTNAVDITKLGIMEIVRKRGQKTLAAVFEV